MTKTITHCICDENSTYVNPECVFHGPNRERTPLEELKRTVETIESHYVDGVPEWVRRIAQRSLAAIRKAEGGEG